MVNTMAQKSRTVLNNGELPIGGSKHMLSQHVTI